MTACLCLLVLLMAILPGLARAETSPDLLAPGGWHLSAPHPSDAQLQEGAEPDGPAETITVVTPSTPFYAVQITCGIPNAVPSGHLVQMHFEARSVTRNPVRVTLEQNGPPYKSVLELTPTLTPEWQKFTLKGSSPGYGPNGLSAHFQAGQQAGTVELRQISVLDLGPDPAAAEVTAALSPGALQARIRRYRMGLLTVRVVGTGGKPVQDAQVQIAQTRHAFLFGCNFFGYDPHDTSAAQKNYQDEFTALFNYATLPFYWGAFEPEPGRPNDAKLQAAAGWCLAHGITPKGHPLIWHEVWPGWAPQTPAAAIPLLHARVAALVPRYRNSIRYWDVLNEATAAANVTPPNGESAWIKRDGPASVVETALRWARAAGTGLPETFLYNDYNTGDANLALLTQLQQGGTLPDAIGLQSHMHDGVWPLAKVWNVCQQFSRFGKPIHFTETTVLSGPQRNVSPSGPYPSDWNTTPEDEVAQAEYVTQFYTVLFSHPSVRAITWWDFSDRNAWQNAPAGLVRRDMTPKPAYTRLLSLIHKTWWSTPHGSTNTQGTLTRRVFYGDYKITVTDRAGHTRMQTVSFPEAAGPMTVTVNLASETHA